MRNKAKLKEEVLRIAKIQTHLTTKQAAIYVNLSERTLETYRNTGRGPGFVKMGCYIRYPVEYLDRYLNSLLPTATPDDSKMRHL